MKKIENCFKKVCDFSNLLEAHKKSRCGKGLKTDVLVFEKELMCNIIDIKRELENKTYSIGAYKVFKIYEPKERDVMALSYRDRIVQHSLCDNVLEPYLDARLDYDNAACRKGKGTHFALNRLKYFMRKGYNKWGGQLLYS